MTRIATFLKPVPVASTALAAVAGAYLAWTPIAGAETTAPDPATAAEPGNAIVDLVSRTSPAVVTVLATQKAGASDDEGDQGQGQDAPQFGENSPFDEFFRHFGMPTPQPGPRGQDPRGQEQSPQGVALGSGFVIYHDGYIVTNNHVVEHADYMKVRMSDDKRIRRQGRRHRRAEPTSRCSRSRRTDLPDSSLGDSDKVARRRRRDRRRQPLRPRRHRDRAASSRPMARDIDAGPYVDFIQTDAAINRGNSGGPTASTSTAT